MDPKRIPFTPEDERKIASAGLWGLIVGATSVAVAVLTVLTMLVNGSLTLMLELQGWTSALVSIAAPGVQIVLNLWLLQAALAFRKVALTDEADHAFLLQGFRRLRTYFFVQCMLIIGGLVLAVFFGVAGAALFR
jgi:hypothetical protein